MKPATFVLAAWGCFASAAGSTLRSSLRKADPDLLAKEKEEAEEYMEEWRDKGWDSAKKSCDVDKLPATTDRMVFKICGPEANQNRCVCSVAKAHSCHIGCKKLVAVCPPGCQQKKCYQGDPANGGTSMSRGGSSGTCYNFATRPFDGVRYCGKGGEYQSGLFLDCTGCNPTVKKKAQAPAFQKPMWMKCMADCFPTPTCHSMCAAGTPECFTNCVEKYKSVVEPYWDIFKGSLTRVPILSKTIPKKEVAEPVKEKAADNGELDGDDEDWDDEDWDEEMPEGALNFAIGKSGQKGSKKLRGHLGPHKTRKERREVLNKARALGLT